MAHDSLAVRAGRAAALAVLRRLRNGELVIVDGGQTYRFGEVSPSCPLSATVTVRHPGFYRALLRGGNPAMALSYIDGDWDCDDPVTLTRIACRNLHLSDALLSAV